MNNDEQHRRDCEARYVMKMSDADRQAFYAGAPKHRGKEAANRLIDDVNAMRRKIKEVESVGTNGACP